MTMLTYTVLTDPAPLEASASGRSPSTGTVYLLVTNTGPQAAYWSTITVEVPVGNGAGDLTSDFSTISPRGEYGTRSGARSPVNVQPGSGGSNSFQVTASGGKASFVSGDHLVLTLENVTVTAAAGLAVLRVTEHTGRTRTGRLTDGFAAVALVKTAPKEIPAPRDFRPDNAMVDAGTTITLSWEGSDDFEYRILFPGGQETVPQGARSWSPAAAPRRATTYTLAATSRSTPGREHFLTTTVQVRNPVLETLTVTTGVTTPWVQGANGSDGTITFSQGAVNVWSAFGSQERGTVFAGKADLTGVNTEWVQGRSTDDGWISFPKEGLNVRHGSGAWGTVFAEKADLTGVNTRWVQGRSTEDGWISFPRFGIQVSRGGTDSAKDGVVYTENIYANDRDDSSFVNLHSEGITVYSPNGRNRIGSVTARIDGQ
ncbi:MULTISPECIES: hypothetical protein [Streptosporangium]|uniref:Fibronectin type-III domain-containing protein n=2 Tax=Streptosporangium vulgare TaxID=46190 RepID=A0ABV5TTD0_9ACTN